MKTSDSAKLSSGVLIDVSTSKELLLLLSAGSQSSLVFMPLFISEFDFADAL